MFGIANTGFCANEFCRADPLSLQWLDAIHMQLDEKGFLQSKIGYLLSIWVAEMNNPKGIFPVQSIRHIVIVYLIWTETEIRKTEIISNFSIISRKKLP